MADAPRNFEDLGPNEWLVDEMYEQYRADPASVSESWQEFFADYRTNGGRADRQRPLPPPHRLPPRRSRRARARGRAAAEAAAVPVADPDGVAIKGAAARIVTNMEASLGVPTATSFREVPAKLLEVNRRVINGYLGRTQGGKISFTHLIGYAVVRAIADEVPAMNASYVEADGKPRARPPRAPRPRPGRRRGEGRRLPDAAGALHPGRRHPRLPGLLGRPTRTSSARSATTSCPPTTSPAPRSASPTPAPSAPSARCRA